MKAADIPDEPILRFLALQEHEHWAQAELEARASKTTGLSLDAMRTYEMATRAN